MTLRIGITGQNGFIGYHLLQNILLKRDQYEIIPFEKEYFADPTKLQEFVRNCDVIVHLAAMNRGSSEEIYATNLSLVEKLISAMEITHVSPHIIFSSSTQEMLDNPYGKSKKLGTSLFSEWAEKHNAVFTHFIIPNVFGPFGKPYYNSVVATFCHQLTHDEEPQINVDATMKLIYVGDLAKAIIKEFSAKKSATVYPGPVTDISVTGILAKLREYKSLYFEQGIIPHLITAFDVALFNTFQSFCMDMYPIYPELHADLRGSFVEVIKEMTGGQTSFSTTAPSVTRGNHYHLRKIERFCVVKGDALIQMRRVGTEVVHEYHVSGTKPAYVDMPIYYTHNIKNIGNEELLTIFWINEFFDPNDPDTYYEEV